MTASASTGPRSATGAFVGTNSSLVAPVKIGNRAYVGSGSVITKDVPDDAMAVERSQQTNREGGATRYREMKTRGKKPKGGQASPAVLSFRLNAVSIGNNY